MYDTLNNFSSTLSHYISLNYRNYELYLKNKSLHEDKVLKSKISLLQSLREFIHVYPGEEDSLFIHISEMGFDHITAGMDINIQNLNIELKELYTKRSDILKKKIPTPLRTLEIERIMRDPFLMLLRKSAGLTEELTPAEYSALLNKEIQTEVTDPQKLISLAIASYTESDGREAIYYYRKALDCKELPSNIRVFIEQSLSRLLNQENSMLSERLNIGDVIFKINGNVLLEPAEILSTMATASKEENILLEVYTKEQKRISISLPGRTHLECIVSQSVMLNLFFI